MKKLILSSCFVLCSFAIVSAQSTNTGKDPEAIIQVLKKRIVDEFKVTNAHADSILAYEQECQVKTKGVISNSLLAPVDKQASIKNIRQNVKTKIGSIVSSEQVERIDNFYLITIEVLRQQYNSGQLK